MKKRIQTVVALLLACSVLTMGCQKQEEAAEETTDVKVGPWKTAQTIQPFFYDQFADEKYEVEVLPFTNPGDQKAALLAGELDMTGTTLVTAISAAANG